MSTKVEFTQKEWDELSKSQDVEIFSIETVQSFMRNYKQKQDNMDEFEKSCFLADLVSLQRVEVLNDDLSKSIHFMRETQTEVKNKVKDFSSDLYKSNVLVYRDTPLNRLKGIVGLEVDSDVIEKARKAEPIGTEKTYGGKLYIKTEKGWRPKPKGAGKKEESTKEESKETSDSKESKLKDWAKNQDRIANYERNKSKEQKERDASLKKIAKQEIKGSSQKNSSLTSSIPENKTLSAIKAKIEKQQKNIAAYESAIKNTNEVVESYASDLREIFPGLNILSTPNYHNETEYKSDGYVDQPYICEFNNKRTLKTYEKAQAAISVLNDKLKDLSNGELFITMNPYDLADSKPQLKLWVKK